MSLSKFGELAINKGYDAASLAKELMLSPSTINTWMTTDHTPYPAMIPKICSLLDCTEDELRPSSTQPRKHEEKKQKQSNIPAKEKPQINCVEYESAQACVADEISGSKKDTEKNLASQANECKKKEKTKKETIMEKPVITETEETKIVETKTEVKPVKTASVKTRSPRKNKETEAFSKDILELMAKYDSGHVIKKGKKLIDDPDSKTLQEWLTYAYKDIIQAQKDMNTVTAYLIAKAFASKDSEKNQNSKMTELTNSAGKLSDEALTATLGLINILTKK